MLEQREAATQGDGRALFLSDMTDEEYDAHTHEHERGWGGFMDKIRSL